MAMLLPFSSPDTWVPPPSSIPSTLPTLPAPGVEHLSLAVAVCGQPHSLLSVLQQTLPPQIYQLLLQGLVSTITN